MSRTRAAGWLLAGLLLGWLLTERYLWPRREVGWRLLWEAAVERCGEG